MIKINVAKEDMNEVKDFHFSPQAKEFLKDNYQFTELVRQFEEFCEVEGKSLDQAENLAEYLSDGVYFSSDIELDTGDEYHYGETFSGGISSSDFDAKLANAKYVVEEGKPFLKADLVFENDEIILWGDSHDYSYYEEPSVDEKEVAVKVIYDVSVDLGKYVSDELYKPQVNYSSTEID